jgi:Putative Ig domain
MLSTRPRNSRRSRPVVPRRSSRKSAFEVLEGRTLLTSVQASLQTFYLSNQEEKFVPVDGGPAIFQGLTYNYNSNVNYTDADWVGGSFALGDFGSVQFQSTSVDPQHRNYFVAVVPVVAGVNLSGLTATVSASDGFNRPVAALQLQLPDPNGTTFAIQFYATTRPDDGSSSLDPSVLQLFMTGEERSAVDGLNSALKDLEDSHQELLRDTAEIAAKATGISLFEEGLARSASLSSWDFVPYTRELLGLFVAVADLGEAIPNLFTDLLNPAVQVVQSACQRVLTDQGVADSLAAKTLFPTRIVVTGTSDDAGIGVTPIGGIFQHYRNDFQFVGSGHTQGTSVFRDAQGNVIASGPIDNQNYYDDTGAFLYANSTVSLPGATLLRYGVPTGPTTFVSDPNGDGDTSDGYSYFPGEFRFSLQTNSNGAFSQGLSGFATTGNVAPMTMPDGTNGVAISEDSPSSLATSITVPAADIPLLSFSLLWPGGVNSDEVATFSIDFTDANQVTTQLYSTGADDASVHGDQLHDLVVPIPTELRGQTGVIRFLLDPTELDGVDSQVLLGGFVVAGIANQPPILEPIDDQSINEKVTLFLNVLAVEPDVSGPLIYSLGPDAPNGAKIDPSTGVFTWTPTEAQGPGTFPVTVEVLNSSTPSLGDQESFTITVNEVNDPPVLDSIASKSVNSGILLSFSVTASDSDLPANHLTYSLGPGAPDGASIDPATGIFMWTPTNNEGPGQYPITVRVTDDGSPPLNDAKTFQVKVTVPHDQGNRAPILEMIPRQTVFEGGSVLVPIDASDPDSSQSLAFSLDSAPAGAKINASNGLLTWIATAAPGAYPVTVRVTDNGSPSLSTTATFKIRVLANIPTVMSAVINDGSAQRSMVKSLTVTFSTVVTFSSGAFALLDKTTGKKVALDVATLQVGNQTKAVLTFPAFRVRPYSLDDGQYALTVYGNLIHGLYGQALDGDGNGTPGGNYVDAFFRLFGDSNGDGVVNGTDLSAFQSTLLRRAGDPKFLGIFDYNGDGIIDLATDNAMFMLRYRKKPK